MSELQATVEFSVELYKFYNVDLFQRGFYQIRTSLRVSPKLSVKIETNLAKNQKTEFIYPACIVNGCGVSKTFQILYRNEEVLLDDVIMFRAHLLVDSHKIEETLENAEFVLLVELWFTEQTFGPNQHGGTECVSTRTLQLHFSPTTGLHYHLPVLFDYFHLAAVTVTIHATLVALHQPFINTPRSAKPLFGNSYRLHPRHPQSTVDTLFFENVNSGTKCVSTSGSRLTHARHVHKEVCSILLATYDTLQSRLHEYMKLLPAWQQLKLETSDYLKRLNNLSEFAKECHRNLLASKSHRSGSASNPEKSKLIEAEDDFVSIANSDIAQLCAENILLWQQFLETFTCKDPVHQHLAKNHHHLRVKRFSEAFFVVDNPRQSAAGCYDANYQNYLAVSDMVRRSRYLATLPPLPVMCLELDGDLATMPIIFEDLYQDMAEFVRRRSGTSKKSGSDPLLNTIGERLLKRHVNEEECSCGIVAILESRSQTIKSSTSSQQQLSTLPRSLGVFGIEEEKVEQSNDVVTAALTLGPRRERNTKTIVNYNQTLPARHSKSLDYLKNTGLYPGRAVSPTGAHHQTGISGVTRSTSSQMTAATHTRKNNLRLELKRVMSSTESTDSLLPQPTVTSNKLKLEQSVSVPYNLSNYETSVGRMKHSDSTMSMPTCNDINREKIMDELRRLIGNSSESMPNLVQSAPGSPRGLFYVKSPVIMDKINEIPNEVLALYKIGDSTIVEELTDEQLNMKLEEAKEKDASSSSPPSSSLSDDITSEQSGWVSNSSRHSSGCSHSSSGALSPDFVKDLPDYSTLKHQQHQQLTSSAVQQEQARVLNDTQLMAKLEKLAVCTTTTTTTTTAAAGASSPSHVYEELQLPPPQQFRDVPPPPEPFRDPPDTDSTQTPNKYTHSEDSVDNLLYHVYEGVKEANRREQEKLRQKNVKGSLDHTMMMMYMLRGDDKTSSRRRLHHHKKKQVRDKKSVTTDEGFDESETKYSMNDSDTSTIDSFHSNGDVDRGKKKNPFAGYLFKQDIETLKKTYDKEKSCGGNRAARLDEDKGRDGDKKDCDCYQKEDIIKQKNVEDETLTFIKAKEEFKRQMNFTGMIYSDFPTLASTLPYFHISDEYRIFSPEGLHLIVCVHGLDGNSADLRLIKTYLELGLPGANLEFLMSERNQGDTFSDFDTMTDKLVSEILYHVDACGLTPSKISFIGHSLGNIIIRSAITRPQIKHLISRFHTFLSLSGPHLGTLYNNSGLVNMGMWFMQKWKKSGSLLQLALRDSADMRQSFLYRLSQRSNLQHFRHVLLCGSSQDRYVPMHSARIELCKAAIKDTSVQGAVYREMVHNIMYPVINSPDTTLVRYDVHHALPNTANSLIGRAAHIAVLDSELFIEKFLVVTGLKYFR